MSKKKDIFIPDVETLWKKKIIKDIPGVTYIGYLTQQGNQFVEIKLRNGMGNGKGRDSVKFSMKNSKLESKEWEYIYQVLKNKSYESQGNVR